jgi:hypothetical protein
MTTSVNIGNGVRGTGSIVFTVPSGTPIDATLTTSGTIQVFTASANADGVVYSNGTSLANTVVGTSGQVLTSNGAGMAPTFQAVSAAGAVMTIDGDSGSATPSAGVITLNANSNCGSTVEFIGSSHTVSLKVTDGNNNTFIGANANATASASGNYNVGYGPWCFHSLSSGQYNTGISYNGCYAITSGSFNTSCGYGSLSSLTSTN